MHVTIFVLKHVHVTFFVVKHHTNIVRTNINRRMDRESESPINRRNKKTARIPEKIQKATEKGELKIMVA